MRSAEPRCEPPPLAELAERLRALDRGAPVPLLVVRLPALERTAWREGLRAARAIERRATEAFLSAVARVLRAEDVIAHDRGSDAYVAALSAPTRDGREGLGPLEIRSALARIAASIEGLTRLDVETGWTFVAPSGAALEDAVARALVRGAEERERCAFFSAVGHELRTPLASIRGYLETLQAEAVDAATRRRFTTIAYHESLRLTRLLEGMFEISLLDLAATFPQQTNAALESALAGAAEACASRAAEQGVALEVARIEPTVVACDGDRLILVLINLIDNAVKHGRPGGRVMVRAAVQARTVHVLVDDDGPGVPAEDRERVFALGERGPTRSSGSGIGLALVRLILDRVGGGVEVGESPLGGARFVVTLPRRPDGAAPGATPPAYGAL